MPRLGSLIIALAVAGPPALAHAGKTRCNDGAWVPGARRGVPPSRRAGTPGGAHRPATDGTAPGARALPRRHRAVLDGGDVPAPRRRQILDVTEPYLALSSSLSSRCSSRFCASSTFCLTFSGMTSR